MPTYTKHDGENQDRRTLAKRPPDGVRVAGAAGLSISLILAGLSGAGCENAGQGAVTCVDARCTANGINHLSPCLKYLPQLIRGTESTGW